MKTHLLKTATACVYGLAASPHEVGAPATQGIIAEMAALFRHVLGSLPDIGSTLHASEPLPMVNLALWLLGTAFVVVAASWFGKSNLAPLR